MANFPFNIAKGRVVELASRVIANDPTNSALVIVALQVSVADATAEDYDDLAAVLGDGGTTEATFTNYARIVVTNPTITVDDTNNRYDVSMPNQTWANAGGAANNTLTDILVCYDPDTTGGTDATIIPLVQLDFAATTDGNDLIADFTTNVDWFRAA